MEKNDLISMAYVLAEYDRQHQGTPGGARKIMEDAPAIDAIPMEWLEKKRKNLILAAMVHSTVYGDNSIELFHAVNVVLDMWQKEQEAQREPEI